MKIKVKNTLDDHRWKLVKYKHSKGYSPFGIGAL